MLSFDRQIVGCALAGVSIALVSGCSTYDHAPDRVTVDSYESSKAPDWSDDGSCISPFIAVTLTQNDPDFESSGDLNVAVAMGSDAAGYAEIDFRYGMPVGVIVKAVDGKLSYFDSSFFDSAIVMTTTKYEEVDNMTVCY